MTESDPEAEIEAEPDPEAESATEPESASDHPPADGFNVGDVVRDADDEHDEPTSAYVCMIPDATAEDWPAYEDTTVAEDNPDYPTDAQVVEVVFGNTVNFELPDWDRISPLSPSEVEEASGQSYSFPAPRLIREHVSPNPSKPDTPETGESDSASANDESESESEEAESEDEKETLTDDESSESDGESAEPSAAIVALQRSLEADGIDAELAADGQSVRVTKLGETYRVDVDGVLEGDGPHRSQLEETVGKLRIALQQRNG